MVISRITSGLGNQLFQYACGRALSLRRGTSLKLDLSNFRQYTNRRYALDAFAIEAPEASPEDIAFFLQKNTLLHRLTTPYARRIVVKEQGAPFDGRVLQAGPDVYLSGYWQSFRYFSDAESVLRNEFSWKGEATGTLVARLEEVARYPSVSVHIRRGDYVSNPGYAERFGVLSMDYYDRALRYLAERVAGLQAYVFSDDPAWVKAHFPAVVPWTIVEGQADTDDLRLMAACRYHVIANSTFSWWGAWLDPRPDKRVLTPLHFFHDPALQNPDLIPDDWVRIQN